MKVKFFDPGKAYLKIKDEIDSEIQRVLEKGDLILRQDVEKFEKSLAEYVGTKYAVALNSCTDALYLALKFLGIKEGDEVLLPSRTFVATPQVVVQLGAKPVFYDIDGHIQVSEKTKAIIPVHIEGLIDTRMEEILAAGLPIIEDSAQALGAWRESELKTARHNDVEVGYRELKKVGSLGLAGCFSFYPAKTLGCYGDAGALTTNDTDLYHYVKGARNHFKDNGFKSWGVNSRMDNIQAAVLNVKLKYYPEALKRRQEIAELYTKELKGCPTALPPHTQGRIWQDYIIRVAERDILFEYLKENGIETMKNNYAFPVPKLPKAQKYEDETLRLPCNEVLETDEVLCVIQKIKDFYEK